MSLTALVSIVYHGLRQLALKVCAADETGLAAANGGLVWKAIKTRFSPLKGVCRGPRSQNCVEYPRLFSSLVHIPHLLL